MTTAKTTLSVRVLEKKEIATDVVSLKLAAQNGAALPAYAAGSHIDLVLPNGITRQYSLSKGSSGNNGYEIAVLWERTGRGGSEYIHQNLREGDLIEISPPRNQFSLATSDTSILFAGGIGITPILAMAEELYRKNRNFELYYCSRNPERAAYRDYLVEVPWLSSVHFHFDSDGHQEPLNVQKILNAHGAGTHLYVCGPAGFIQHVCTSAEKSDWSEGQVHFEHFSATTAPTATNSEFEIVLARRGVSIRVPADISAAQALIDNGVDIPLSCEQGVCGSCVLPVIDGTPDHRDVFLTSAERAANRCFTPCCSRSKTGKLVLDL